MTTEFKTIGELAREVDRAKAALDQALEEAVRGGASFTDLSLAMGLKSEGAVRLKAKRRGWYEAGSRRAGHHD